LDISWTFTGQLYICPVYVLQVWTFTGHVIDRVAVAGHLLDIYWTFYRQGVNIHWTFHGHLLDICIYVLYMSSTVLQVWTFTGHFIDRVAVAGHLLDIYWTFAGHFIWVFIEIGHILYI